MEVTFGHTSTILPTTCISSAIRLRMGGRVSLSDILHLGLALPRLAVDVRGSSRLESSLVLGEFRSLNERLVNELFLVEDTAHGLVVEELGKLEQKGVVERGRGLRVGLS